MRKRAVLPALAASLSLIGIVLSYQYCSIAGRNPSSGSYFKVSFRYSTLNSAQLTQLRRLTFCFKGIRLAPYIDLKNPDPTATTQNYDFNVDSVDYVSTGVDITNISIQPGTYQTIQLFLSNVCSNGRSLFVTNNQGYLSTIDDITLTFDTSSPLKIDNFTSRVSLNLDNIIPNLLNALGDTNLKSAAEASNGTF